MEQEVKEQEKVQIIPTEKEALDEEKDEQKMEKRTESLVSSKSEKKEQEVAEQDEVQIIPTEKEAMDEEKDGPKMEEYETEHQVEEPGKLLYSALLPLSSG